MVDRWQLVRRVGSTLVVLLLTCLASGQSTDPQALVAEAERLVWLRAWTKTEPLFTEAERAFAARGDKRNALYAAINALRGRLPRLPVPDVSQQLEDYLQDPLVIADHRLRLRTLIIKGETDQDLDPELAQQSWTEALALAEKLGEPGWANRARGELGLVAFLQGDINNAIIRLGQAMKVAEATGDVASLVRWMTLFGHGYVQLDRPEQALDFYDRALKLAATVRELQFPLMTYLGKGNALARLGKFEASKRVLADAFAVAEGQQAYGYQAELLLQQGIISHEQRNTAEALELLVRATELASKAGGNRILAEIALALARMQRQSGRLSDATTTLEGGIQTARGMGEKLLLPRLLAELAEVKVVQRRTTEARALLEEAGDLLEGLLTNASSPWVRSRVVGGMDSVFAAQVRLEGSQADAGRLFAALEQARGRSLLELVASREVQKTPELRAGERRLAALQLKLLRTTRRADRQQLLDDILRAEEAMAPASTQAFAQARLAIRSPVSLRRLQQTLRADELVLEYALSEPNSFVVVATRTAARVRSLPGRATITAAIERLSSAVRSNMPEDSHRREVGRMLLDGIPELVTHRRLIVSPDGELHWIPLELLSRTATGVRLLESHVVSYVPSASVLVMLRTRVSRARVRRVALAVSASPENRGGDRPDDGKVQQFGAVSRAVYDVDATQLPPLPSATDEARAVVTALGTGQSTLLLGASATEHEVKRQPLSEYDVLHFAVHGILSTKFPARSALLLRPGGPEDGLVQAREILDWRLAAQLVTLSACDTGAGTLHGQDGVASLVRPFLAAGARSVVANLWTADDRFSLGMMREFYARVASGSDVGEALRGAKLTMIERFGPDAMPKLWGGVLVYGDGTASLTRSVAAGAGGAHAPRN